MSPRAPVALRGAPTSIPEARLAQIRARGAADARRNPFVDPRLLNRAEQALRRRGWTWAESVVGHPLTRRSIARPDLPWLEDGEDYALVAADDEESEAEQRLYEYEYGLPLSDDEKRAAVLLAALSPARRARVEEETRNLRSSEAL